MAARRAAAAARHYWLLLAESHCTRLLFASTLWGNAADSPPAGWARLAASGLEN